MIIIDDKNFFVEYLYGDVFVNKEKVCSLLSGYKRYCSHIRLLSRMMRLEPRCGVPVDEDAIAIVFQRKVFLVSISCKEIVSCIVVRPGYSNPLNLLTLYSLGKNIVFWGDYGSNPKNEDINIYSYSLSEGLKVVYTFPANSIRHIHNILYDNYRHRFFILTGDIGSAVGIYEATEDFKVVRPFLIGSEQYRAVIGKVTEKGLLWATDAVLDNNHLYFYSFETGELIKLADLNGSVIYGVEINDGLLFSTTVESYPANMYKSRILSILDWRLGPGIKSRNVDLLFVNEELQIRKVNTFKKDNLPIRLFQYGQVMFPYCTARNEKIIHCNPMSVKKWDGKTFIVDLNYRK